MSRVQDFRLSERPAWGRRGAVAAGVALVVVASTLWLVWPRAETYPPAALAAVRPGMTRAEIEAGLGRPLPSPEGGVVGVRSNRPNRSFTPDLIEEEGLFLVFDDGGVLVEARTWGFVRKERTHEWLLRLVGIDALKLNL